MASRNRCRLCTLVPGAGRKLGEGNQGNQQLAISNWLSKSRGWQKSLTAGFS